MTNRSKASHILSCHISNCIILYPILELIQRPLILNQRQLQERYICRTENIILLDFIESFVQGEDLVSIMPHYIPFWSLERTVLELHSAAEHAEGGLTLHLRRGQKRVPLPQKRISTGSFSYSPVVAALTDHTVQQA